ncbi:virion structural protein [Klebsiella phage vB_KvM-Eowyn]|uniref:Putative virion structural protein n=1 Tax=Klebsiella phage vB_KvM-Eowyn TaxID=2762819 RepID=A0A7R8MK50_9CAUD|nr:virion structural protein [Klebsiella phage vB_KvM-Eowyn]CAD5236108.1 putative virion structural protein [Klebsiella phage vB_KvM-Eowyn]
MAMPYTRIYSIGYTRTTTDAGSIMELNSDSEAIALFEQLAQGDVGLSNWPYTRNAITCASRLFGSDLQEWFDSQASNDRLTVNARGLLNDTIGYINTGNRKVSLQSWARILMREQDMDLPKGPGKIEVITDLKTNALTQWLRHDRGLIDLVTTMNILFGKGVSQ